MTRTLEVSEETYEAIKDQLGEDSFKEVAVLDDMVGEKFYFRTVTYHLVGKVTKRLGSFLVLEDCSWVADSGRFQQAILDGALSEVEPVGRALINLDTVCDAFPWVHELPKEQK